MRELVEQVFGCLGRQGMDEDRQRICKDVTERTKYCGCCQKPALHSSNNYLVSVQCGVSPLQCHCEGCQHHCFHTHRRIKCWCHFLLFWSCAHLFIHRLAVSHTVESPQADDILRVGFCGDGKLALGIFEVSCNDSVINECQTSFTLAAIYFYIARKQEYINK